MDIKNIGKSLAQLISQSRYINTVREAEERILHYLWETVKPDFTIYLMKYIPTIKTYILVRKIGEGELSDVTMGCGVQFSKHIEENKIIRIPEYFPPEYPLQPDKFYTIFPLQLYLQRRYLFILESNQPLKQLHINFIEGYLRQAVIILERVIHSSIIETAKSTYDKIIFDIIKNEDNEKLLIETILRIFLIDDFPVGISIVGYKEDIRGYIVKKDMPGIYTFIPHPSIIDNLKSNGTAMQIMKKADIPSKVIQHIKTQRLPKEITSYFDKMTYILGGTNIYDNKNGINTIGVITTQKYIPFSNTEVEYIRNILVILTAITKRQILKRKVEKYTPILHKTIQGLENITRKRAPEFTFRGKDILKLIGESLQHLDSILSAAIITDKEIITIKSNDIDPLDIMKIMKSQKTVYITPQTVARRIENSIIVYKLDISPKELYMAQLILRTIYQLKQQLDRLDRYTDTIKNMSKLLPHAMETIGIEPKDQMETMLNLIDKMKEYIRCSVHKLKIAATFHDVGKLYIPPNILLKDMLEPDDWAYIKVHPQKSKEFLEWIKEIPSDIELAVLYHHENYDGSGYPYGIKGDEIPYMARILRVLDAYTAMTLPKVYGKQHTPDETLDHLESYAGIYYDPEIVAILKKIIQK